MNDFSIMEKLVEKGDNNSYKEYYWGLYASKSFEGLLALTEFFRRRTDEASLGALSAWLEYAKELYLNTHSDKSSAFIAAVMFFMITRTDEPLDSLFLPENRKGAFFESLRRQLFAFLKNTPPGSGRIRPRKVLVMMGSVRPQPGEDGFSPLDWLLYSALYQMTLLPESSGLFDDFFETLESWEKALDFENVGMIMGRSHPEATAGFCRFLQEKSESFPENDRLKRLAGVCEKFAAAPAEPEIPPPADSVSRPAASADSAEEPETAVQAEPAPPLGSVSEETGNSDSPEKISEKEFEKSAASPAIVRPAPPAVSPVPDVRPAAGPSSLPPAVSAQTEPQVSVLAVSVEPLRESAAASDAKPLAPAQAAAPAEAPPLLGRLADLPEGILIPVAAVKATETVVIPMQGVRTVARKEPEKEPPVRLQEAPLPDPFAEPAEETPSGRLRSAEENSELILRDRIRKAFRQLADSENPSLWAGAVAFILDVVKTASDEVYGVIKEELFADGGSLASRDVLRREFKTLLADVDVAPFVSNRAFELLPILGNAPYPVRSRELLSVMLEDTEEEDEIADVDFAEAESASCGREEFFVQFPQAIYEYFSLENRDQVLRMVSEEMLVSGDENFIAAYAEMFRINLCRSGRIFFEHIVCAAKSFLDYARRNEAFASLPAVKNNLERAREALLYVLLYQGCPDLMKMEAFETLKGSGFLEYKNADNIKRYALVFVKDALIKRSTGAVCRALSDLISLKQPSSFRGMSVEGKSMDAITEDFITLLMKEQKPDMRSRGVRLLNHLSFEEPSKLQSLASRIQPVNYREAILLIEDLVVCRNRWAGMMLVEAAGRDFMDIRDAAVVSLGRVGAILSDELKDRAIELILEKADECYDEDMRATYLGTIIRIDVLKAAARLLVFWLKAGLHERKEYGNLLLNALSLLESAAFLDFFGDDTRLESIFNHIISSHRDTFIQEFAKRFVEMYRIKYSEIYGQDAWESIFLEGSSRFATLITQIWSLA